MEITSLPITLDPAAQVGASLYSPAAPASPVVAPPELVDKFQNLMSRLQSTQAASESTGPVVPHSAVSKVEAHIQHHVEAINRVAAIQSGDMSVADLQVMQMQTAVQMGMLSMSQAAYFQVLGSAKSSVSALMKNQ